MKYIFYDISIKILILVFTVAISIGCQEDSVEEAYCDDEIEIVDLDDPTSLSFSARRIVDAVAGQWQCELSWNGAGSIAKVYPDISSSYANMSLSYEGGEIRSIVSVRKGGSKKSRIACLNQLEISSVLRLVSSDGALSESWNVNAIILEYDNLVDVITKPTTFNGAYSYEPSEQWVHYETFVSAFFTIENFEALFAEGNILEHTSQEEYIVSEDPEIHENTGTRAVTAEWICPTVENIDKD